MIQNWISWDPGGISRNKNMYTIIGFDEVEISQKQLFFSYCFAIIEYMSFTNYKLGNSNIDDFILLFQ